MTLLTGGGFCCPEEVAFLMPLQLVKNAAMARMNQGKRLERKGDLPEVNEILPYTLFDAEPRLVIGTVSKVGLAPGSVGCLAPPKLIEDSSSRPG